MGAGSVDLGFRVLDESFGREVGGVPAFMVHEDCAPVLDFCRRWDGKKKQHIGDALRYPLVPLLGQAWEWGNAPRSMRIAAPTADPEWIQATQPQRVGIVRRGRRGRGVPWDGSM